MKNTENITQLEFVENYLKTHKRGLTQLQAASEFYILRLSSIIYKLRRAPYNYDIESVEKLVKNKHYSGYTRFVTYVYRGKK